MQRYPTPKLTVIDSLTAIDELGGYLANKDLVAFDTETTGLTNRDQVIGFSICTNDEEAFYVILSKWEPNLGKLIPIPGMFDKVVDFMRILATKRTVMHNAVFDCMMVEAFFKVSLIESLHTDTMIMAHLLDENRKVGLKELCAKYGDDATAEQKAMKASIEANGGTITKDAYELYKADPRLIGKYGAKDAWLTWMLFNDLVPELFEQGLDKFFYEDESMPLLRGPTYEMNTTGLMLDSNKMTKLKKQLEAECLEAKAFIEQEIAPHVKEKYPGTKKTNYFNIGASQQLSWLLFGQLGHEFGTLTKGGKIIAKALVGRVPYHAAAKRDFIVSCERSVGQVYAPEAIVNGKKVKAKKIKAPWAYIACDNKTLAKIAPKLKWVAKLMEYQKKQKMLSTYITGIEERVQYGIVRPSFLQHGTATGRYASRAPNFQNLPRDDKRIKDCIIPRPGKVFVGADQSQLEPRVFAYTSGDERLKAAFKGTDDFYSVIGMEVYDKFDCIPKKDGSPEAFGVKYKKLRQDAKVFCLASTYGATGFQLAAALGKSSDDAQRDIDEYFEKFPGVRKMMVSSHDEAKKTGKVHNLFGRPRRLPDAKKIDKLYGNRPDLPYEARNILNQAVNFRIQSTGASIVNRIAIALYNNLRIAGIDAKIVLQVHDSIIVECNEADAENVAALLQDAMENTIVLEGIAFEAVPDIGKSLAEA